MLSKKRISIAFQIIISILCLLTVCFPYALAFNPDSGKWENFYIWQDDFLMMLCLPIFLIWIFFLWKKKKWQMLTLVVLSLFLFCYNLSTIFFIAQDFLPKPTLAFSTLIFPLLCGLVSLRKFPISQ